MKQCYVLNVQGVLRRQNWGFPLSGRGERDDSKIDEWVGTVGKRRTTAAELVLPEPFWTEMADLMPPPSTWLDAG